MKEKEEEKISEVALNIQNRGGKLEEEDKGEKAKEEEEEERKTE